MLRHSAQIAQSTCLTTAFVVLALSGCADAPVPDFGGRGSDSTGLDSSTSALSGSGAFDGSSGAAPSSGVDTGGGLDSSTGGGFVGAPDGGSVNAECDLFAQDCPPGEKCMPWANDGGSAWNATRCSPIVDDPGQIGEACTVEGSPVSGIDDCQLGAMCWNVDPRTATGTCTALCTGSPDNPVCEEPETTCSISNGATLTLCLPTCDPMAQDCDEGLACYPVRDAFLCVPDVSSAMGGYGASCEAIASCDPGLVCFEGAATPGCESSACCTELCSLSDPRGDAQCTGAPRGQQCQPWFDEDPPPQYEDLGVCQQG